jgi:hypothetical protein
MDRRHPAIESRLHEERTSLPTVRDDGRPSGIDKPTRSSYAQVIGLASPLGPGRFYTLRGAAKAA